MLKTSLTTGSIPSIEKLDTIARKTGLIMRKSSRFSAHGFLLALMQTVLRGNNSFNHLALSLSQHQAKPMSRQAMLPAPQRSLIELPHQRPSRTHQTTQPRN